MNPERWSQIQELFYSALEREPPERGSFLDAACGGDSSLRTQVEALLAADEKATSFLHRDNPQRGKTLEPGCNLGTYRILASIGQGGMGEVYRARDEQLCRDVAIKVLRSSASSRPRHSRSDSAEDLSKPSSTMPSPHQGGAEGTLTARKVPIEPAVLFKEIVERDALVARRFEREALLTASVQHPAVVPIYERGELSDGRPFYAMKLVSGRSLRELIDERDTLPDRMGLVPNVIAVAEALAHAHAQRIIHRDVKPSNIIVGEFGETVLIDWGLAKDLAHETDESPLASRQPASHHTVLGEIIGTPAYMSPEQAKGSPVDERADVFSLGATLYHVVTGRAPYEGETPSILPNVKRGEYPSLREQRPEVSSELTAIISKAMAHEPSHRYPTARELAEDLRRFQAGQLVLSHRYSLRELVSRWAKRHRTLLVATAGFFVIAVVSGAVGIRRIIAERDRANRESEASARVTQFMTEMFKVSDPSEARGNSVTAREILDNASKQIEGGLRQDPVLQAHLMNTMGAVYAQLGLFAKARPLAERAVELRRKVLGPEHLDTLRSMNNLGIIERGQGRHAAAAEIHRQVLEIRRRVLGPKHTETVLSMNNLAAAELSEGHYTEAEKLFRQVVDIRRRTLGPEHPSTLLPTNNLAVVLLGQGKYAESEKLHREVLDIQQRVLGSDHPDTLRSLNNVAVAAEHQGHFLTAETAHRQVVEARRRILGPEHPETLRAMSNLADDERSLGHYAEAEPLYRAVIEAQLRVLGPDHPDRPQPMKGLGSLYFAQKRFEESEKIRREALEISRRVRGPEQPITLSSMNDLAEVESARGRHSDAEKLCREAIDAQRRVLGPEHPDTLLTMITLAKVWSRQGRTGESEKMALEALASGRRVPGPNHLGLSLYALGSLALKQGDRRKALDYLRQAVDQGLTPSGLMQMQEDDELKPLGGDSEFEAVLAEAKKRALLGI